MEAMILHTASMTALFVDQLAQVPVMVQCAPMVPEPWWKWLVQSLFQLLLSVIPVAGGVWIALWSFQKSSRKEHEKWVRDQKVPEWKCLIRRVAEFERIMPLGEPGLATVEAVRYKVLPLCDRVSHFVSQALFIAPILLAQEIQSEVRTIMIETDKAIGRIEIFDQSSLADKDRLGTPVTNAMEIRGRIQRLHAKLVSLAEADMF
ncbi:MAG: hypothetical protein ABSB30_00380 [Terracidiphilus sp.]